MLRKLSLVAVAAASLGAAALAPTSASAWVAAAPWRLASRLSRLGWPPRLHRWPGHYGGGYGGCYARRLVPTPWGPRWRLVNRRY